MSRLKGLLGALALGAVVTGQASSCGFDGLLGDSFSAQHPKSLGVALAVAEAAAAGVLPAAATAPIVPGQKGYWTTVAHLEKFSGLVGAASSDGAPLPAVSILLVDSQLWTRLSPGPRGYELEQHVPGPREADIVVVTTGYIVEAVTSGRLSGAAAISLGVLAVDNDLGGAGRKLVTAALTPARAAAAPARRSAPFWGAKPGVQEKPQE